MKLIFVAHRRDASGGEICPQMILERLSGHSILAILPEGAFARRLAHAGIQVHIDNDLTSMSRADDPYAYFKLVGRWPALVRRLARKFRDFDADLIISSALGTLPYAGPAARLAGIPVICIHHHPIIEAGTTDAKLVRLLDKFCDGFIALSEAMNRGLQAAGIRPDRVQTIYNGLDLDVYKPIPGRSNVLRGSFKIEPEVKLIGLVATISENKGHHIVIKAARILRDEFKVEVPWKVFFIGEVFEKSKSGAEYQTRLHKQIESDHLQDRVVFGGRQSDMIAVYRDLDIVLNASLVPEPMGATIYEAMAMGRLPVTNNLGGLTEMVRDEKTGFLVPPGDSHALAAVLARILQGKVDLPPILAAGRQRAEEAFDIRDKVREYLEFFEAHAKKR
jgi:glycosyltransferase involved in cell wall biosynthesis